MSTYIALNSMLHLMWLDVNIRLLIRDMLFSCPQLVPLDFLQLTFFKYPPLPHRAFEIFSLTSSSHNSLSFPSFSSPRSTFLLFTSPLFVSPLFSSPVLSSPLPSVYPIWLSHLSWERSQGTWLLIQFPLNLMALSSAFAISATCRETKQKRKKKKETEKH